MKTIVLGVGDPHAKVSNAEDIVSLAHKIADLAEELKGKNPGCCVRIVVLGDLANDHERIHLLALKAICQFFDVLLQADVQVDYVVGNHDMLNNSVFLEELHVFIPFKKWPGLRIHDTVASDGEFLFCPYVAPGRFGEAVKWHKRPTAIFCHQEFRGVKMGAIESKIGDVWPPTHPLVVSGHIHDEQKLQDNILYLGEPMDSSFGNTQTRTIGVLSFEGGKLTNYEKRDLGMPKKTTVTLEISEAISYVVPENTSVRINLQGTTQEHAAFKKTKEYANLAKNTKVVPKYTDRVVVVANTKRESYLDILKRACETETPEVMVAFDALTQTGT